MTAAQLDTYLRRASLVVFHALLAVTPLFFSFATEELFEFNKIILVYAGASLLLGLSAARLLLGKQPAPPRTPFDAVLGIFLLSQILSTLFSIHPVTSIFGYYSRFHGGLLSTIAYLVIYYSAIISIRKKDLPALAVTTFFSALMVAVYAILEHFGHSFSCLLASGGTSFDAQCWVQDVQTRVFATFGQPNWLAAYLVMIFPLSFAASLLAKKTWMKIAAATLSVLLFITLLYTRSRSGILAQAVGMVIFVPGSLMIFRNYFSKKTAKTSLLRTTGLVVAACVLAAALIGTQFTPALTEFTTKNPTPSPATTQVDANAPVQNRLEIGGTDSADIRRIVWTGALDVWKRYPLLGSGVETFAYSYYLDRPVEHNLVSEWDFLYNKAHNEVLNILATTGAVGLLAYILLHGMFAVTVFNIVRTSKDGSTLLQTLSLTAGLAAVTVSNFFGFSTVMVALLSFLFFAYIARLSGTQPIAFAESKQSSRTQPSGSTYVGLTLIGLATLVLFIQVVRYYQADVAFATGKAQAAARQWEPAVANLSKAVRTLPKQADYYDELSTTYSELAIDFGAAGAATDAAIIAQAAEKMSDITLELNPQQRNFYKTRARLFITLSQLEPEKLQGAEEALEASLALSPTDAKLRYNLGLIELGLGKNDEGIAHLEEAVALKPNYETARFQLAQQYYDQGKIEKAVAQLEYILEFITPENTNVQETLTTWQNESTK